MKASHLYAIQPQHADTQPIGAASVAISFRRNAKDDAIIDGATANAMPVFGVPSSDVYNKRDQRFGGTSVEKASHDRA